VLDNADMPHCATTKIATFRFQNIDTEARGSREGQMFLSWLFPAFDI